MKHVVNEAQQYPQSGPLDNRYWGLKFGSQPINRMWDEIGAVSGRRQGADEGRNSHFVGCEASCSLLFDSSRVLRHSNKSCVDVSLEMCHLARCGLEPWQLPMRQVKRD